jgi:hypothetical protein
MGKLWIWNSLHPVLSKRRTVSVSQLKNEFVYMSLVEKGSRKSTALSLASQKENLEMVNLLLRHKASVDIEDEQEKESEDCGEVDDEYECKQKNRQQRHFFTFLCFFLQ